MTWTKETTKSEILVLSAATMRLHDRSRSRSSSQSHPAGREIVASAHNLYAIVFDCLRDHGGALAQQLRLIGCIHFHGEWKIAMRSCDCRHQMLVQHADLSRHGFTLDGRRDCSAAGVAHDQDRLDAEHRNAILQAGDNLRRHHISRNPGY